MSRDVTRVYADPLDRVWITTAERIGLRIERTPDAFATTDGRGALRIGEPSTLDADDCLAQMIFHELCHSLVEGPDAFDLVDWGLDNVGDDDLAREHACLRVQALLAGRHGLRGVLAPTTDHRAFFDGLGADPLEGDAPSVRRARPAVRRAEREPWGPHLERALEATAAIVRAAGAFAEAPSLFASVEPGRARHPAGGWAHPSRTARCGDCAWRGERCVVREADVEPAWPACEAFVAALDCRACAACCREGFDVVELEADDEFAIAHPSLVSRVDGRLVLRRVDGRCPPLEGDGRNTAFSCATYADRPRACRDLPAGGEACLFARRRLGLAI